MKEGDIMLTMRGLKVRIVSLDKVPCTNNWITVWDIENEFCFYMSPLSLKPLTK